MKIDKSKLKEYEALGLVADSMSVRTELITKMNAQELTLEDVQSQLKKIQKEAHKRGLFVREDFFKEHIMDEEMMAKMRISYQKKEFEKMLPERKNKEIKNKI